MRKKMLAILALLGIGGGGAGVYQMGGFEAISRQFTPVLQNTAAPLSIQRNGQAIRIASFNLQVYGQRKASKPAVMDYLARIMRDFDVVAVQEIRSQSDDVLPQLVDKINEAGRNYDYVIGPRLGRSHSTEQYAFIFDRASVEIDRSQLYTVIDPDDLLHREPLVGWFRVRGPDPEAAFTFTLVNIHVDPDETELECNALADVFRRVRNDGRGEDDVILLGDFNVDQKHLSALGMISGMRPVVVDTPTNTRQTAQYDNLLFTLPASAEFTGRWGVIDFMYAYNLTQEEALEISDHLPVWAEFSTFEGGILGRVAALPSQDLAPPRRPTSQFPEARAIQPSPTPAGDTDPAAPNPQVTPTNVRPIPLPEAE